MIDKYVPVSLKKKKNKKIQPSRVENVKHIQPEMTVKQKVGKAHTTQKETHNVGIVSFLSLQLPCKTTCMKSTIIYNPMIYELWNSLIGAKLIPNIHFRFLKCANFWQNVQVLRCWTCWIHWILQARTNEWTNWKWTQKECTVAGNRFYSHASERKEKKICFYLASTKQKKSVPKNLFVE